MGNVCQTANAAIWGLFLSYLFILFFSKKKIVKRKARGEWQPWQTCRHFEYLFFLVQRAKFSKGGKCLPDCKRCHTAKRIKTPFYIKKLPPYSDAKRSSHEQFFMSPHGCNLDAVSFALYKGRTKRTRIWPVWHASIGMLW